MSEHYLMQEVTCGCGDIRPHGEMCHLCGKCQMGCCQCDYTIRRVGEENRRLQAEVDGLNECNARLNERDVDLTGQLGRRARGEEIAQQELQRANATHEQYREWAAGQMERLKAELEERMASLKISMDQNGTLGAEILTARLDLQAANLAHEQYREWAAGQVRQAKAALREAEYILRDSEHLDARIERYFEAKKKP